MLIDKVLKVEIDPNAKFCGKCAHWKACEGKDTDVDLRCTVLNLPMAYWSDCLVPEDDFEETDNPLDAYMDFVPLASSLASSHDIIVTKFGMNIAHQSDFGYIWL